MTCRFGGTLGLLLALVLVGHRQSEATEVVRDAWGIPHVLVAKVPPENATPESDEDAFYALGFVTAQDRGFQMHYSLRMIQGRSAEILGRVKKTRRNETTVDHDRKMRTFGFYRAAQQAATHLEPETLAILQAYSDGVNAYFKAYRDELNPRFSKTGLAPETWTPADCIACWWHLGQFFATDGTRDLIASRRDSGGMRAELEALLRSRNRTSDWLELPPDDSLAVVQRNDVSDEWVAEADAFAQRHGVAGDSGAGDPPKFSHAWVVGGSKSTTGSAILVSDPQTPVRYPSLFYEYHVQGKTFNVRGIGVPGCPMLLIGFNQRVAWGVTALGADQADLFKLVTNDDHPNSYQVDNEWRPMTIRDEVIQVRGESPVALVVRETHFGPVATEFCFAKAGEPEVALKRVPVCDPDVCTLDAFLPMARAANVNELNDALAFWRFPSANLVCGDRDGNIAYRTIAAIPVRARQNTSLGREASEGHDSNADWQGYLPPALLPQVVNPRAGVLFSANHQAIGSWYPLSVGAMTGAGGETIRSWRLRELLENKPNWSPDEVLDIHFDAVNPARRDIVRLGLHLRQTSSDKLTDEANAALERLQSWYEQGARMSLDQPGSELALELNTFFRIMATDLASVYGGGESGLARWLKSAVARIQQHPQDRLMDEEIEFIETVLTACWRSAKNKYGDDPDKWNVQARAAFQRQKLGAHETLDGFAAIGEDDWLAMPNLQRIDGGTIGCQSAQSYTQFVRLDDVDLSQSILPIGQSERATSPMRTSTLSLWQRSQLHPAPLSRDAVMKLEVTRVSAPPR